MDEFDQSLDNITKSDNIGRVTTGISRLDELLSGGFPKGSITLVSGTPGSGKTILCFHYIWDGLSKGERCLYLTSDQKAESIVRWAEKLGFDFRSAIDNGSLKLMYLNLDKKNIHKDMEMEIKSGGYKRIVLDSLTPVSEMPVWMSGIHEIIPSEGAVETRRYPPSSSNIAITRTHIRRIISILGEDNCTAMVTSEVIEGSHSLSRDTISEFLVDGIILLDLDTTMDRRKLMIRKMRATDHTLKPQDITITDDGIKFI